MMMKAFWHFLKNNYLTTKFLELAPTKQIRNVLPLLLRTKSAVRKCFQRRRKATCRQCGMSYEQVGIWFKHFHLFLP